MRHLIQPNRWTCLPTSFAMVLCRTLDEILAGVGHDGSEILWPDLPEPRCRRGFHIQEMISYAWSQGFTVTPFQAVPRLAPDDLETPVSIRPLVDLRQILDGRIAVLTGLSGRGSPHAVAWDGKLIRDPNGETYGLDKFALEAAWLTVDSGTNAL